MKTCPNCKLLFSKNENDLYYCDSCDTWFYYDQSKNEWIVKDNIPVSPPKKPELVQPDLSAPAVEPVAQKQTPTIAPAEAVPEQEPEIIAPPAEPKKFKRDIDLIFFNVRF